MIFYFSGPPGIQIWLPIWHFFSHLSPNKSTYIALCIRMTMQGHVVMQTEHTQNQPGHVGLEHPEMKLAKPVTTGNQDVKELHVHILLVPYVRRYGTQLGNCRYCVQFLTPQPQFPPRHHHRGGFEQELLSLPSIAHYQVSQHSLFFQWPFWNQASNIAIGTHEGRAL